MKIGMMLGFEDSIKTITTIAQEAERSGIHSLGRGCRTQRYDHCGSSHQRHTQSQGGDLYCQCLCSGAVDDGVEARDLNEISGGRFVLGVGTVITV